MGIITHGQSPAKSDLPLGWIDAKPCPICGKRTWCRVSADGAVVCCRRVETGCRSSKCDINGTPYYLHIIGKSNGRYVPRPTGPPKTHDHNLNSVYGGLLHLLELTDRHRDNLNDRGLNDREIDRRGYRTLPARGRVELAGRIHDECLTRYRDDRGCRGRCFFEEMQRAYARKTLDPETYRCSPCCKTIVREILLMVPGFIEENDDRQLGLAGAPGLLIPCRNLHHKIVGLKVRVDDPGAGGKYRYISSGPHGGPSPGAIVHFPLDFKRLDWWNVRLTEGELKADICTARTGLYTVSCPGVTGWRAALNALAPYVTDSYTLAFDNDANDNPTVARALRDCARAIKAAGHEVRLEVW
jgi:hypothetical protein